MTTLGLKFSIKTRQKMSDVSKGKPKPWLKGKPSGMLGKIPWNKGKKIDRNKYPNYGHFKHGLSKNLNYIRKQRQLKKEKLAGRPKPEKCEICNKRGKICFDHNHKTDKFRGWICYKCNLILGEIKDSIKFLEKLLNYLKQNG